MPFWLKSAAGCLAAALVFAQPAAADEAAQTATATILASGGLADGATELSAMIAADPANEDARLGLGMVQFLQSVEHLSQNLYRYGLQPSRRSMMVPIMRLPVPVNPNPEPIDYAKFRAVLLQFGDDLAIAEATFAGVTSPDVKLAIDVAATRYDADGDGDYETLGEIMETILGFEPTDPVVVGPAVIAFDTADAYWFRGYAHVLMAMSEFLLAHDWQESFDVSFHIFFPRLQSAFAEKLAEPDMTSMLGSESAIADLISFLHIRWPVAEPQRMAAVREHLKGMVAMSREEWRAAVAETDDDREWLPAPGQTSAFGAVVTEEQLASWHEVLDEVDALLDGRMLMPHWRFNEGINMRRVFEEPRPFDLILWITGPAALPYLEDGPVTTAERWNEITRAFDGNFGSYAIWFN